MPSAPSARARERAALRLKAARRQAHVSSEACRLLVRGMTVRHRNRCDPFGIRRAPCIDDKRSCWVRAVLVDGVVKGSVGRRSVEPRRFRGRHDQPTQVHRPRNARRLSRPAAARHCRLPAHDRAAVRRPREVHSRARRGDEVRQADPAGDAEERGRRRSGARRDLLRRHARQRAAVAEAARRHRQGAGRGRDARQVTRFVSGEGFFEAEAERSPTSRSRRSRPKPCRARSSPNSRAT